MKRRSREECNNAQGAVPVVPVIHNGGAALATQQMAMETENDALGSVERQLPGVQGW
jgi:hypothetical protein